MSTHTNNNGGNEPRRSPAAGRRPIKVTPRRKAEIDPHMIALVYFLIASRIVREAKQNEAAAGRTGDDDDGPVAAIEARS